MLYFMKANEQNVAAFLQDLKRLHIYMYLKKYKWRVWFDGWLSLEEGKVTYMYLTKIKKQLIQGCKSLASMFEFLLVGDLTQHLNTIRNGRYKVFLV